MPTTGVKPQGPVSYAPPSIPPASRPPTSNPPTSQSRPISSPPSSNPPTSQNRPVSSPPRAAKPQLSNASGSIAAPPSRPIGLIVLVLLVDLGLAATGGVLLSKGLAKADKKTDAKSDAPIEKNTQVEAPAAAPAAAAIASTPEPVAVAPADDAAKVAAAREAPKDTKRDKAKAFVEDKAKTVDKAKPDDKQKPDDRAKSANDKSKEGPKVVTSVPTQPVDPYPVADMAKEIDAAAAKSKSSFDRCATDAGSVQGSIKIAFQVRADGHVINAAAVENSTGDAELARCLVTEVSTWRVSAHDGAAINLLRSFSYP